MTFSQPIPAHVLYFATFGLFMYQTLDAVDSKQARRTDTASLLGMLMDHGCDALLSVLTSLGLAQAAILGLRLHMLVIYLGVQAKFFMATWEEYHTHICRGKIGLLSGIAIY
jgi:ethanolaminephosphotransferase